MAYSINFHIINAQDEGLNEIEVFKGVPYRNRGHFWCGAHLMPTETGTCNRSCMFYDPRNKKSGICRHHSPTFVKPGDSVKFKVPPITPKKWNQEKKK